MPLAAVFIRDEQHRGISFPKVVPGGSYVSSIKTAHDKNNARINKNNTNDNDIVNSDYRGTWGALNTAIPQKKKKKINKNPKTK